jgi:hypothetical protein
MRTCVVIALLSLAACLPVRQTPRPRPKPSEWKNLRILPWSASHDDLIDTMRAWSRSLDVGCAHCHVRVTEADGRAHLDFVSDVNPQKNTTRAMLKMTRRMNADYITGLAKNGASVTCYTCHRGKVTPEWKLPPQQPKA